MSEVVTFMRFSQARHLARGGEAGDSTTSFQQHHQLVLYRTATRRSTGSRRTPVVFSLPLTSTALRIPKSLSTSNEVGFLGTPFGLLDSTPPLPPYPLPPYPCQPPSTPRHVSCGVARSTARVHSRYRRPTNSRRRHRRRPLLGQCQGHCGNLFGRGGGRGGSGC